MSYGTVCRVLFAFLIMADGAWARSGLLTTEGVAEDVPQLPEEADRMAVDVEGAPALPDEADRSDLESQPEVVGSTGRWLFSGGFGANSDFILGQIMVGYYWVRYVGIETNYFYYQVNNSQILGVQYGPEIDLMVRAHNPTMITPFAGFGPGYTKWHRRYQGEQFSTGSSMTGNVLFGADIALSRHFGLQIFRKNINYWGDLPISYTDRVEAEPRSSWVTNIGFRAMF